MDECAAFVSVCLLVPADPESRVRPLASRPSKADAGESFGGHCQCKSPTTMHKRRKLAIEPPNLSEENFAAFQSFWCIKFSLLPGRNFNAVVSLEVFFLCFLFCSLLLSIQHQSWSQECSMWENTNNKQQSKSLDHFHFHSLQTPLRGRLLTDSIVCLLQNAIFPRIFTARIKEKFSSEKNIYEHLEFVCR